MTNLKLPRRKFLGLAAGAAALPTVPHIARAQAYPTRPITMVVPYAAGGPADTIAANRVPSFAALAVLRAE